jgi:hypothetical protein
MSDALTVLPWFLIVVAALIMAFYSAVMFERVFGKYFSIPGTFDNAQYAVLVISFLGTIVGLVLLGTNEEVIKMLTPDNIFSAWIIVSAVLGIGALSTIIIRSSVKGNWTNLVASTLVLMGFVALMMAYSDYAWNKVAIVMQATAFLVVLWGLKKYWNGDTDDQPVLGQVFPNRSRSDADVADEQWRHFK